MEIHPTPEQEELISRAIEAGRFENAEDAVKEALSLWEQRGGMPHWRSFEPRLTLLKHPLAAAREFRSRSDPCGTSPPR